MLLSVFSFFPHCFIFKHVFFPYSTPLWNCVLWRTTNDQGGTWALTVMSTLLSHVAVATRLLWTLRPLAGTGLLLPNATKPTTVLASVSTCSCKSTHTLIWSNKQIHGGLPVLAVPLPKCHPLICYILMTNNKLFMAKSLEWL